MLTDKFHNKYQSLLEQEAHEAPDDVWNNISKQLDNDATLLRLDNEEQTLINEVWNDLEDELDIDEVWGCISQELDSDKKKSIIPRLRYWLAAAVLLMVIGLTNVLYQFSEQETQPLTSNTRHLNEVDHQYDSIKDENKVLIESVNSVSAEIEQHAYEQNVIKQHTTELLRNEPDAIACTLHFPNETSSDIAHSPMLASGSFSNSYPFDLLQKKEASLIFKHDFDSKIPQVLAGQGNDNEYWFDSFLSYAPKNDKYVLPFDRKDSRWTTGVITALKNTYLLNAETFEGFSPTGMNNTRMTFQPDLGLNVQYAFNTKFIFETNLFLSSSSKQTYKTYSYGEYVKKETELSYMGAELALKHNAKNSLLGDKLIRRNIGGVYFNYLQSASETLANKELDVSSRYAAIDYGLLLGQEFEIRSKGPVKVSTGLTIKYGLPNVFVGDDSHPGKLNKTHNASVEFRIGIAYRWRAKTGIDHYLGYRDQKAKN
ncbi:MAG: hypothetical protein MI866_00345 [Bacteroidales bacterium]|nr:hypothetical protein [Bacteroidales bacterium]